MLKKTSLLWLAVSSGLLAGCSVIPTYERPAAPVAAQFSGEFLGASGGAATPAADIEWQNFFTDPKLNQLILAALQNNRDLRIAMLTIEQARAQFQIRRADQFPTLNAALTGSRQSTDSAASGSGISSLYSAGLAVTAYEHALAKCPAGARKLLNYIGFSPLLRACARA